MQCSLGLRPLLDGSKFMPPPGLKMENKSSVVIRIILHPSAFYSMLFALCSLRCLGDFPYGQPVPFPVFDLGYVAEMLVEDSVRPLEKTVLILRDEVGLELDVSSTSPFVVTTLGRTATVSPDPRHTQEFH